MSASRPGPADLLRRMREKRMRWVELEESMPDPPEGVRTPAKRVRIIRPTEVEIARHLTRPSGGLGIDHASVVMFTVDWEGFTEADLLGRGIGGSDAVPYNADLWFDLAADRSDWLRKTSQAILDDVVAHIEAQEAARKN